MLSKTARPLISSDHTRLPERVRLASFPTKLPLPSDASLDDSIVFVSLSTLEALKQPRIAERKPALNPSSKWETSVAYD
ncbi:MAG: hypothetical protein FD148_3681 [Methylocystaceae bacterium]|nr:MAG: hypothetical protein FD148_3681 [Methylocystaceae bacterium]